MDLLSVGEVAARLGVTPSTVRMWGERYGLVASQRSAGGHRRYTAGDLDRLRRMNAAVISGTSPSNAASHARGGRAGPRRSGVGGPGGAVLAVPGAVKEARGMARAASRLDEMSVEDSVVEALRLRGTLGTWNEVLRPVLVAAGQHWQRTGAGIEIEHLLTQAVTGGFVRYVATIEETGRDLPVLLAGGPVEEHVLPLHAVRAALAERGVPARLLGPRTPMSALAAAARRTRAAGALVWISRPDPMAADALAMVRAAHRRLVLLVGGAGWAGASIAPATECASLTEAVEMLEQAWKSPAGSRGRSASR